MTDATWSSTPPKEQGHYWVRLGSEFVGWMAYWDDERLLVLGRDGPESPIGWRFGPRIPSPDTLARVAELLRRLLRGEHDSDAGPVRRRGSERIERFEGEARTLLAELEGKRDA